MVKKRKLETVTQAEFGRRLGISRQMVGRYVSMGLPTIGQRKQLQWPKAKDWIQDNVARHGHSHKGSPTADFYAARARKEAALASLRELQLAVQRGDLLNRREI